ncbi:MAG: hypothetical protein AB1486_26125 [Planctomycetota bacterium]
MQRIGALCVTLVLTACHDLGNDSATAFRFDPGSTTRVVTNAHYSLIPGTTHRTLERGHPHSVLVTRQVSHFPTTVVGIPATVVLSRRFLQGEMTEERFEYFVQDDESNVWILGADVTQFTGGEVSGHDGTWRYGSGRYGEAGVKAGLVLAGRNRVGESYVRRSELGDRRVRVDAVDSRVLLPELGRFEKCLKLIETGGNEETLFRYLAPEVGPILVEDTAGFARGELIEIMDDRNPDVHPSRFVQGVDHPLFPLPTGRTWRYAGTTDDGFKEIVITVLEELTQIIGVDCTTVRVEEYLDGEVTELAFDWFAQDHDGNVWYFGEDVNRPREDGSTDKHGSWKAGENGARPGIEMLAIPRVGDSYRQEYAAGLAEDLAVITSLEAEVETGLGKFTNCLEVYEENPLEPDSANEFKYFAMEVGLILEVNADGSEYVPLVEVY